MTSLTIQISILGTDDKVTLKNWYQDEQHQLDAIHLSTGNILLNNQVDQLVQAMAAFNAPSSGEMELTGQIREELAPVLAASWQ